MDLALLVPHAGYPFADVADALAGRYRALFARHGLALGLQPWTSGPPEVPTLAALAWGYHLAPHRWRDLLSTWPETVPLLNPPDLLAWNTDKQYLVELDSAGVATVPTRFADRADASALASARDFFGAAELVVKPRVSGAGHLTALIGPGDRAPDLTDAMIQPFLASVRDSGEKSLFFFESRFSHAVRKVAADGEIRVQREYGGTYSAFDPDPATLALAWRALAAAPLPPAYARVDIVAGADGEPLVMELELIEPDLYLDFAPDGGDAFVAVVRQALGLAPSQPRPRVSHGGSGDMS
jgi:hypothetical protein